MNCKHGNELRRLEFEYLDIMIPTIHIIVLLTHKVQTKAVKLTCFGVNICNSCRHTVDSAWTNGSSWSCIIAHAHKKDERAVVIDAELPKYKHNK